MVSNSEMESFESTGNPPQFTVLPPPNDPNILPDSVFGGWTISLKRKVFILDFKNYNQRVGFHSPRDVKKGHYQNIVALILRYLLTNTNDTIPPQNVIENVFVLYSWQLFNLPNRKSLTYGSISCGTSI